VHILNKPAYDAFAVVVPCWIRAGNLRHVRQWNGVQIHTRGNAYYDHGPGSECLQIGGQDDGEISQVRRERPTMCERIWTLDENGKVRRPHPGTFKYAVRRPPVSANSIYKACPESEVYESLEKSKFRLFTEKNGF